MELLYSDLHGDGLVDTIKAVATKFQKSPQSTLPIISTLCAVCTSSGVLIALFLMPVPTMLERELLNTANCEPRKTHKTR